MKHGYGEGIPHLSDSSFPNLRLETPGGGSRTPGPRRKCRMKGPVRPGEPAASRRIRTQSPLSHLLLR
jgi:hypothetical protein